MKGMKIAQLRARQYQREAVCELIPTFKPDFPVSTRIAASRPYPAFIWPANVDQLPETIRKCDSV